MSWAQDTADEMARRHFESGEAYLKVSNYENALREFNEAYELSKRPEILLTIATVKERMADVGGAVSSLEKYLQEAPQGEDNDTVRIRIENLKRRLEQQAPPPPADAGAPAPPVDRAEHARPEEPPPQKPDQSESAKADREPSRIPAYIAFGVGGLSAVGAVVTGIMAQGDYSKAKDTCSPFCTDSQLSSAKTMAWTSTALTGVAVVGVGLGITLWLTSGSKSSEANSSATHPTYLVGFGPGGAAASASWRF